MKAYAFLFLLAVGCGKGDPAFTLVQGLPVYLEGNPKVSQWEGDQSLDIILEEVTKMRPDITRLDLLEFFKFESLDLTLTSELEFQCDGTQVYGCFEPGEIRERYQDCRSWYILAHELGHAIQWYWLGTADHNHRNQEFFGPRSVEDSASERILQMCASN